MIRVNYVSFGKFAHSRRPNNPALILVRIEAVSWCSVKYEFQSDQRRKTRFFSVGKIALCFAIDLYILKITTRTLGMSTSPARTKIARRALHAQFFHVSFFFLTFYRSSYLKQTNNVAHPACDFKESINISPVHTYGFLL